MSVDVRHNSPEYFDYEEPGRRWPFVVLAVALTILVLVGSSAISVQRRINPPGDSGPAVEVTVDQGMSTSDIATLLEREGVIASATVFS